MGLCHVNHDDRTMLLQACSLEKAADSYRY